MTPSEPLPTCRRKALWSLALGLAMFALAGLAHLYWRPSDYVLGLFCGFGVGFLFAALLLWFSVDMGDPVPKRLIGRYQREVGVAMGAYVLVMLVWKQLLHAVDATWLRVLIALFPAVLVCFVLRAFVRYVRDSDEMQRRIELESCSISAMLVAAAYLGAGFLQSAKLIQVPATLALIGVFPALCLVYGVTKIVVTRRYL